MHHRPLASAAAAALVVTALAVGASAAGAAPIVQNAHYSNSFTIPDDTVCGITGTTAITTLESYQVLGDGTAKDQQRLTDIFTSAATGKSIQISLAYQNSAAAAVLNPDGSTTVISTEKGLLEQIKLVHGPVLVRDAGVLTFEDTFNADGSFRSSTLIGEDGPHPDFTSGLVLGCEALNAALS